MHFVQYVKRARGQVTVLALFQRDAVKAVVTIQLKFDPN